MTITLSQLEFDTIPPHANDVWKNEVILNKGEHYLFEAPSGSGKSTLIHALYGVRKDYTGSAFFNNESLQTIRSERWAVIRSQQLAVVFQDLRLFDELTALENIQLKLRLTQAPNRILEFADALGMKPFLEKKVKFLSVGQKQRIAIIRALSQPFECILLDEPFSHLDNDNASKAMQLIAAVCKEQDASLILTSLGNVTDHVFSKTYRL